MKNKEDRCFNFFLIKKSRKAFTLVEILFVIALMGVLTVVSLTAMEDISDDAAFEKTYARMLQLKRALVGDLDANKQGIRDYYGYLGDVGNLPVGYQGLQALLTRPSDVPEWTMNSTAKIGIGWRGPYLTGTTGVSWLKDAWGRDIIYNTTGTPYILSYGADGAAGGTGSAADIQINLGSSITYSTIHGIINTGGEKYSGNAVVKFYYPQSGSLETATATVTPTDAGYFTFSNIPFGVRSFKVFFPNEISPENSIGPSFVSIDNPNYVIPYNYLDSAPGALPHLCSNTSRMVLVPGSTDISTTTNRVYFEVDISESITLNSVFVALDNGAKFRGMRIGNDIKNCDGGADTGFKCMAYDLFNIFGLEDTSAPFETDPENFPEINLDGPGSSVTPWTIGIASKTSGYVQLSSVTDLGRLELRLACDYLRIL